MIGPFFALGIALPALALHPRSVDRRTGLPFATRSEAIAPHVMAATSQPLATQTALEILRGGGSAVDAAIAANAVLGLVEPTGCGVGGDLFAIVWDAKERRLFGLNGSGRSPRALTLERLRELGIERIPPFGALPISVPGCVDGWVTLHERFGRLPLAEVLAPAIGYAKEGAPISEVIAFHWGRNAPRLAEYEEFARVFIPGGVVPGKGDLFKNPDLARTYERIAAGGRDAFYEGELASAIVASVRAAGGYLGPEDLAEHRSEWVEPVSVDYRGHTLWELPPNGQGVTALQILRILEGYDVAAMGFGSAEHVHAFVEAKKLAFEDRARFFGDPDFCDPPLERLLSAEYAAEQRARIDLERAATSFPPDDERLRRGDTIYLAVADAEGNMVSWIQSNFRGMGSGIVPAGCGFVLQDRGELFDLEPGRCNSYAPGKRPFHTIIPAFVTRGTEPWLAFGVMGGDTQPQMHAQILMNLLDFGMNLQEAGDAPRILHSGSSSPTGERAAGGGEVHLESGFVPEVVQALARRGHRITVDLDGFGGYQAVMRDAERGVWFGASESRKDGMASGW